MCFTSTNKSALQAHSQDIKYTQGFIETIAFTKSILGYA